jgi:uncharacterized membrane protein
VTGAPDSALARRVGAVTIAVIATAIAVFVFLLDRAALGSPTRIRVTFRHTAGLREHAALVVAGRPIGRVESIAPVPHGRPGTLGGEVGVALTVAIDEDSVWKVPARADIFISSRGPVSDKYLEVAPPTGDPGPPVHDGQELRGIDPPSLDSVLQRTWANLTTFHDFVEAVRPDLAALRTQLGELRTQLDALGSDTRPAGGSYSFAAGGSDSRAAGGSDSRAAGGSDSRAADGSDTRSGRGLNALVTSIRELAATARHTRDVSLGGERGLARLRATLDETRATVAELRATVDALRPRVAALTTELARVDSHVSASVPVARIEQALASARAALDKLDPLVADIDAVRQQIANGEGSLLRVIRDPEFPEDAKDLGKVVKRHPWRILEHARD